jgi:serine protease Do
LTVKVGELKEENAPGKPAGPDPDTRWGMNLQDLTPEIAARLGVDADQGAVVTAVEPGGAAERAALRRGDVILEVNRKPVGSADDVKQAASGEDSLLLLVQRQEVKQFVVVSG